MGSTIKQRLRRYNGTDYDTIHLETEKSCITDFPSSMPASDVYSWAKASSKPSYSTSELSNWPSGGTDGQVLGLANSALAWVNTVSGGAYRVEFDINTIDFGSSSAYLNAQGRYQNKPDYVIFISASLKSDSNYNYNYLPLTILPGTTAGSNAPSFRYIMASSSTYVPTSYAGGVGWIGNTADGKHRLQYQRNAASSITNTYLRLSLYAV